MTTKQEIYCVKTFERYWVECVRKYGCVGMHYNLYADFVDLCAEREHLVEVLKPYSYLLEMVYLECEDDYLDQLRDNNYTGNTKINALLTLALKKYIMEEQECFRSYAGFRKSLEKVIEKEEYNFKLLCYQQHFEFFNIHIHQVYKAEVTEESHSFNHFTPGCVLSGCH